MKRIATIAILLAMSLGALTACAGGHLHLLTESVYLENLVKRP